jgi:hypothetical protein
MIEKLAHDVAAAPHFFDLVCRLADNCHSFYA